MTGGQVAALLFAILLLLPGGCFLFFGIGFAIDNEFDSIALVFLPIAAAILGFAGFLFWVAMRRRPAPPADQP